MLLRFIEKCCLWILGAMTREKMRKATLTELAVMFEILVRAKQLLSDDNRMAK